MVYNLSDMIFNDIFYLVLSICAYTDVQLMRFRVSEFEN